MLYIQAVIESDCVVDGEYGKGNLVTGLEPSCTVSSADKNNNQCIGSDGTGKFCDFNA